MPGTVLLLLSLCRYLLHMLFGLGIICVQANKTHTNLISKIYNVIDTGYLLVM